MKRKLIFVSIFSLLLIFSIYLSLDFFKNREKGVVIEDKYKVSSKDIEGKIEESKLITYFNENKTFLELGITSNLNNTNTEIDYELDSNRSKLIWSYLITHPDINKTKEIYTYNIEDIDNVSKKIFGTKTKLDKLDTSLFNINNNLVTIKVPTNVNNNLPVYYKTEVITEEVYSVYYVDFGSNIDDNLTSKYVTNQSKVEDSDLIKYNPKMIILTIKNKNNNYYLLKSSVIEDYKYE